MEPVPSGTGSTAVQETGGYPMNMLNLPKKVYFKDGSMNVALRELIEVYHLKRAYLVWLALCRFEG